MNNIRRLRYVKAASGIKSAAASVCFYGANCRCLSPPHGVAAPSSRNRIMTDQSLARICAEKIFTALNSRDLSALAPFLADDAVFDFPGVGCISGKNRILLFFKILFRKYPRLTFSLTDIIIEGERVCAVWNNEGENAHGRAYRNRGITFMRIANGQIIFISDYFKDTSFVESA